MAKVLDGKKIAQDIKDELKVKVQTWTTQGNRQPSLHCIKVHDDNASEFYLKNLRVAAEYCGIDFHIHDFKNDTTENELIKNIEELNKNNNVDGILLVLPIPGTMSERRVSNVIAPNKDVDGFHITNIGQLCVDMPSMVPATALAAVEILKRSGIETFGRDAVVVNRSKYVGMPIAMILHTDKRHENKLGMDATVTICHRYTPPDRLKFFCQNADIIVTATGIPKLITSSMVKPGATVIDIGMTTIIDANGKSKITGDVDYDEVAEIAGAITPVPVGVGPVTVAMLMSNVFQTALNRNVNNKHE